MIAPSTVLDPACCARAHCRLKSTQRWSLYLVAIQGICFSSAQGVGIPVLSVCRCCTGTLVTDILTSV